MWSWMLVDTNLVTAFLNCMVVGGLEHCIAGDVFLFFCFGGVEPAGFIEEMKRFCWWSGWGGGDREESGRAGAWA